MANAIETLRNSVKAQIKSLGLNQKDVSISVKYIGYSKTIIAKIKNAAVSAKSIYDVLVGYEKYQTCPHTGEILSGGNTFIDIYGADGNYVNTYDF